MTMTPDIINFLLGSRAYDEEQENLPLQESSNSTKRNSENYHNRNFAEIQNSDNTDLLEVGMENININEKSQYSGLVHSKIKGYIAYKLTGSDETFRSKVISTAGMVSG